MSNWKDVCHFIYGRGFWYADPIRESHGLTDEELLWVPDKHSMCILWHVGHVAHRERVHIGQFVQGIKGNLVPPEFEVFGPEWASPQDVRGSIDSVQSALEWVRDVRKMSHEFIKTLTDDDFGRIVRAPEPDGGLTVAHWLMITAVHGGVHIGRIQLLRAMLEGKRDRAC